MKLLKFFLLVGFAGLFSASTVQAQIKIGFAAVLSGDVSWIGEQQEIGSHRAVADINAAGGLLGQQVELVVLDDFCNPAQAAAVARQLVDEAVVFVHGHTCSGASLEAAPIYQDAGILMISSSSTNPALTDAGRPNVFRVCGRDDDQGTVAGDYLADHWADKNIAVIHDSLAYGQGLAEETKRRLDERKVPTALFEGFEAGQPDYSSLVDKLEAARIDVLYMGSYLADVSVILKQAKARGMNLQAVSGDAIASDDFVLFSGQAGVGTLFTFGPDAREIPAAASVARAIRDEEGFEPAGYTLYGYAAVQVWAAAVRQAQSSATDAVAKILRSASFDSVLGTVSFDEKGDIVGVDNYVWYVWGEEKYSRLK